MTAPDAPSKYFIPLSIIVLVAASWKALLLVKGVFPFNADEAIVALMARHIVAGERPVFFYGQVYMGSLDAFLAAAGFALFGAKVWVIRILQTALYLGIIISTAAIGKAGFGSPKSGLIAAALLAIPTVNMTLYTTVSLGGYGEALLLGNLMVLLGLRVRKELVEEELSAGWWWRVILLGFLAGLGLWANGLTLVYSAPVGVMIVSALLRSRNRIGLKQGVLAVGAAVGGALGGAAPWWIYAVSRGGAALLPELLGKAVAVERAPWLAQIGGHVVNFILLGLPALLGFRPPWEVRWLALPLLPAVLMFWVWVAGGGIQALRSPHPWNPNRWLWVGIAGVLSAGFLLTPFGVDPSGRYFLPLSIALALAAGDVLTRKVTSLSWQTALVGLVVIFQGWGTWQCAQVFPPGLTTQFDAVTAIDHRYDQDLIDFLREKGETRGYTNYWVAYPLAFLSQEELIYIPRLPYHPDMRYTTRDDRYAPYGERVGDSPQVAYITTRHPELDAHLRESFAACDVTWQEEEIGDYHVFYSLSAPVHAAEVGLGGYGP